MKNLVKPITATLISVAVVYIPSTVHAADPVLTFTYSSSAGKDFTTYTGKTSDFDVLSGNTSTIIANIISNYERQGSKDYKNGFNITGFDLYKKNGLTYDLVAPTTKTALQPAEVKKIGSDQWNLSFTSASSGTYRFQLIGEGNSTALTSLGAPKGTYSNTMVPVSSVPEPETYAMFLAGLGFLGLFSKRNQIHAYLQKDGVRSPLPIGGIAA
jgi:hypothetical protein